LVDVCPEMAVEYNARCVNNPVEDLSNDRLKVTSFLSKKASISGRPKAVGPGVPTFSSSARPTRRSVAVGLTRTPRLPLTVVLSRLLFGTRLSLLYCATPPE
jgi:hypothetical protein